jgi:CRP-like cAMP-binding protein
LNGIQNPHDNDRDKLSRLKAFSWLTSSELTQLAGVFTPANYTKSQVIFAEAALGCEAHILLRGIARITCHNVRGERVTMALLAPGLVPEFPALPHSRFDFRCEAYSDCRAGCLSWNDFNRITQHNAESAFKKIHENDLDQWYRLLLRSSGCLNLSLHERVAITLRELSSDFGIKESRGMLLRACFSHQDIADLVGASRPRVTEHLAQLEREQLIIRQGRYMIVCVDELDAAIAVVPFMASSLGLLGKNKDLSVPAEEAANVRPRLLSDSRSTSAGHKRVKGKSNASSPSTRSLTAAATLKRKMIA